MEDWIEENKEFEEEEEEYSSDELREDLVERIDQVKNENEELRDENYKLLVERNNAKSYANFFVWVSVALVSDIVFKKVFEALRYN